MECKVKGCESWESYAFLEFCEKDALCVYPLIERLALEGVRVWYQTGEDARVAAQRLEKCKVCIFALSSGAAEQHGFVNKLVYAVGNSRPSMMLRLEQFNMTVGLMIQTDALVNVDASRADFYDELLRSPIIQACRDTSVKADESQLSEWKSRAAAFYAEYDRLAANSGIAVSDDIKLDEIIKVKHEIENDSGEAKEEKIPESKPEHEKKAEEERKVKTETESEADESDDGDVTVYDDSSAQTAAVVRLSTGQVYEITKPVTKLGRKPDKGRCADITFDNTHAISRFHAILTRSGDNYYLRNDEGKFGTSVGGRELQDGETVQLDDKAVFRLTNEDFCLFLGEDARRFLSMSPQEVLSELDGEQEDKTVYKAPGFVSSEKINDVSSQEKASEPEHDEKEAKDELQVSSISEFDNEKTVVDDLISEMTVRVTTRQRTVEDPDKTVRQSVLPAAILRLKTGELFRLQQIENVIGRRTERRKADIMLDGNMELSREHAVIYQYQGKFMIRDCGSLLGTYIGEERVDQERATELADKAVFSMAGESFLFLLGDSLRAAQGGVKIGMLCCEESGEVKYLIGDGLRLDRNHPWRDGLLAKGTISRNHAQLYYENGEYMIRDLGSSNGTFVNNAQLEARGGGVRLNTGDRIWVHDVEYRFTELELK